MPAHNKECFKDAIQKSNCKLASLFFGQNNFSFLFLNYIYHILDALDCLRKLYAFLTASQHSGMEMAKKHLTAVVLHWAASNLFSIFFGLVARVSLPSVFCSSQTTRKNERNTGNSSCLTFILG